MRSLDPLVIEAREQGVNLDEPRIRYYETMNNVNGACRGRAQQVLQAALPVLEPLLS